MSKDHRNYIIGTAGHIDHGKTTLIKALTGINTDRLKEEQERGITIDLGFAFFVNTDGRKYGIVDVPGHEKFIPNMLAGAHGFDVVMMVVAADDGVKPQTIEHFEILHLLKIPRAMFVITKIDMVEPSRIEETREEIEILIEGSYLENSRIIPASGRTGEGLDNVRAEISRLMSEDVPMIDKPFFRLPIDRAFSITGFGTVVTGTIVAGTVSVDDEVTLAPLNKTLRIRNVEIHGENVKKGLTSQRTALNVAKADKDEITRGMQLVSPPLSSQLFGRYYASCEMLTNKKACRLKNFSRARLFTGTAETMATLINLSDDRFEPSGHYVIDMSLRDDLFIISGDRFIIRDETNRQTIGGGEFILPSTVKKAKMTKSQMAKLQSFPSDDLKTQIETALEFNKRLFIGVKELSVLFNRSLEEINNAIASAKDELLSFKFKEKTVALSERLERMKNICRDTIDEFHTVNPELPGIDKHELRDKLKRLFYDTEEAERIWGILLDEGELVDEGEFMRLSSFKIKLRGDDSKIAGKILELYSDISTNPPKRERLTELLKIEPDTVQRVFAGLAKSKVLVGLTSDIWLEKKTYDDAVESATEFLRKNGSITVKDFKDLVNTNRNLAVVILESMDKRGITVREENTRTLRKK